MLCGQLVPLAMLDSPDLHVHLVLIGIPFDFELGIAFVLHDLLLPEPTLSDEGVVLEAEPVREVAIDIDHGILGQVLLFVLELESGDLRGEPDVDLCGTWPRTFHSDLS